MLTIVDNITLVSIKIWQDNIALRQQRRQINSIKCNKNSMIYGLVINNYNIWIPLLNVIHVKYLGTLKTYAHQKFVKKIT